MLDQATGQATENQGDSEAFTLLAGDAAKGLLLICDHASNALPPGYGTLGLPPEQLERHIGYDIGAAGVTLGLSRLLNVPAVLSRYSRLLIDPNRGSDDPTLVMRLSDGAIVPGNGYIEAAEIAHRVMHYYTPYHATIDAAIDRAIATGRPPAIFSIHSFTPNWRSQPRPWHATVLWDKDPRLAVPLIGALRQEPGLVVGENEPYTGKLKNDCLYRHGTHRGLAHALIEIRQDLIREPEGQKEWAERLARLLERLLQSPEVVNTLNVIDYYGSHTDTEGSGDPRPGPIAKDDAT